MRRRTSGGSGDGRLRGHVQHVRPDLAEVLRRLRGLFQHRAKGELAVVADDPDGARLLDAALEPVTPPAVFAGDGDAHGAGRPVASLVETAPPKPLADCLGA